MKTILFFGLALVISLQSIAQITDQDGYTYNTITIGNMSWMAENLNVSHFRNGDPIPEAKTNEEWKKAGDNGQPAWCYYKNEGFNGEKYGKLYNWYATNDSRGLAPKGWHIPSDEEWNDLEDYLGASGHGTKMKNTSGWKNDGNGTNESGFSGLPGGRRDYGGYKDSLDFYLMGYYGSWWSSTELRTSENLYGGYGLSSASTRSTTFAWMRSMNNSSDDVSRVEISKAYGYSVRCIRN
ncbi:MAG: fibrobacter succinogenes major paralogous domain-containing protein [Bacteroidetes bacterium]|nr:fibrobacter succinogenes major paralogous domain-containing protein [Bacteroidota bacterium]